MDGKSLYHCYQCEVILGQAGFIVRAWYECQGEEINLTCSSLV